MVVCLERDADLHMAQLVPLPLTVSCFSKIHIGVTFLIPAHSGSPGKRAVKRVCVCVCLSIFSCTVLFVSISQVIGCEDHLRNDLYCVEWGVKLYSFFQLWLWIWWRMVMCCRQVLHNTALQHVRHNRSCIEPCLRQLMISLESLKVFHNVNYTVGS